MTRALNQFSFSEYDTEHYEVAHIDGHNLPSYEDEDGYHLIMNDTNFLDVVIGDEQEQKIQKCYDEFTFQYNRQHETEVKVECVPNYYGSVFMEVYGDADEVISFIKDWIDFEKEENICYHQLMPNEYETYILAFNYLNLDLEYEMDCSKEDARAVYVESCNILGFEPGDDYL